MNREQKKRLMEKIEYDIKSDMIAQEEKMNDNYILKFFQGFKYRESKEQVLKL